MLRNDSRRGAGKGRSREVGKETFVGVQVRSNEGSPRAVAVEVGGSIDWDLFWKWRRQDFVGLIG